MPPKDRDKKKSKPQPPPAPVVRLEKTTDGSTTIVWKAP